MASNIFEMSDEELEAVRRQRIFDRSKVLAEGYRRPAQAQAGAMLGGALVKTLFGLKSPEEQELAKRAAFQQYMQKTGLSMASDPLGYTAAAASAASKFGLNSYAERAANAHEQLKARMQDNKYKEKEISLREEGLDLGRAELAERRRSNMSVEDINKAKNTYVSLDDPRAAQWSAQFKNFPPELRALVKVNLLGEPDFSGIAGYGRGGRGGGSGNDEPKPLKPDEMKVSPEEEMAVTSVMLENSARRAQYGTTTWTGKPDADAKELSEQGIRERQALSGAAKRLSSLHYGAGRQALNLSDAARKILALKEKGKDGKPYSWDEVAEALDYYEQMMEQGQQHDE